MKFFKRTIIASFILVLTFILSVSSLSDSVSISASSKSNGEAPPIAEKQTATNKQSVVNMENQTEQNPKEKSGQNEEQPAKPNFIKWIDFNVTSELLARVCKADPQNACELLAYVAIKNGNNFSSNQSRDIKNLNAVIKDRSLLDKYSENKYYKYYVDCYHAILDGIIGEYFVNAPENTGEGTTKNEGLITSESTTTGDGTVKTFGLKAYHPIARGFGFNCYDDFGSSRGYGFKRKHLGHDLFGRTGTPIVAVEGGTITELGWNRYGGWRIGIRSDDTKRYYYYAHLRKDKPYAADLKKGDKVTAGQVIGYLGTTGYSRKENVNMKQGKPHIHFGIQIIFDESQEDGSGEIWIDCWQLCKFLSQNKMKVTRDPETREYHSVLDNTEPESDNQEHELEPESQSKKRATKKRKLIPFFGVFKQYSSSLLYSGQSSQ